MSYLLLHTQPIAYSFFVCFVRKHTSSLMMVKTPRSACPALSPHIRLRCMSLCHTKVVKCGSKTSQNNSRLCAFLTLQRFSMLEPKTGIAHCQACTAIQRLPRLPRLPCHSNPKPDPKPHHHTRPVHHQLPLTFTHLLHHKRGAVRLLLHSNPKLPLHCMVIWQFASLS